MTGGFEALETVAVVDSLKSFNPSVCQLLRSQTSRWRCAVALSADSVECPLLIGPPVPTHSA